MKGENMNKHYSAELKERVVKEYLEGAKMNELVLRYELSDSNRIRAWRDQYLKFGCFPDRRGTGKGGGRPRNVDTSSMTQEEYIRYLEMENDILKQLRSLSSKKAKSNIK